LILFSCREKKDTEVQVLETSKDVFIIILIKRNNKHFLILFSCREKKDTEVQVLETSKDVESETISELEQKNEELREKLAGKRVDNKLMNVN
jgi:hypothetical protein